MHKPPPAKNRNAPAPTPAGSVSWTQVPDVVRATKTIRQIDEEHSRDSVDRAQRIGRLLREVHSRLAHGEWMRWLASAIPIDLSTAQRYIAVTLWAETEPADFANVRSLSLRKLYRLMRVPLTTRQRLYGRAHRIPGTDLRLTLADMSLPQLELVLRELGGTRRKDDSSADIIQSSQRAVGGIQRQMNALVEQRAKVDLQAITKLHTSLVALTKHIHDSWL